MPRSTWISWRTSAARYAGRRSCPDHSPRLAQNLFHLVFDDLEGEGLDQVIIRPGLEGCPDIFLAAFDGNHEHRQIKAVSGQARMRRNSSRPLRFGICQPVITRPGLSRAMSSQATSPSSASSTSAKPISLRTLQRILRMVVKSSTTRTFRQTIHAPHHFFPLRQPRRFSLNPPDHLFP